MLYRNKLQTALSLILTVIAVAPAAAEYLNLSISLDVLWILLLPAVLYVRRPGEFSSRYFFAALAGLSSYLFVQSPIFLLFAAFFIVFFIVESKIGKLNRLAPVLIILITPLTKYFLDLFGFPVRLALTKIASIILNSVGFLNQAQGNAIIINGNEFTVDPACMGLKMVITALLICLLLVSWFEKRNKQELPVMTFAITCMLSLVLVVVSNLVRIILLTVLPFPPETFGHEMTGINTLISLVVIPQYVAIGFFVKKFGKPWGEARARKFSKPSYYKAAAIPLLIVILAWFSWTHQSGTDIPEDPVAQSINIHAFEKKLLPNNVIRFRNEASIIYIKPCKGIFRSDHHPMLCWQGSGYEFSNEKIIEFNGTKIYTARMLSDNKVMHTAWWYDNGKEKTINQICWRWKMLKGEPAFRLVNITSHTQDILMQEINKQWNRDLFSSNTTTAGGY